jgi:molecular chaperone DnaK (HSP70)
MSGAIAIDFGTTRTKVAYLDSGGRPELLRFGQDYSPFTPSLFYLPKDGGPIVFGADAERMLEREPSGVVDIPKRRRRSHTVRAANGRTVAFSDLLLTLFASLREKTGREIPEFHTAPPTAVTLTVPASFGPTDREAWASAARAAGFEEVTLIDEPVAAAMAWLRSASSAASSVIVLDSGGGTVDWRAARHLLAQQR